MPNTIALADFIAALIKQVSYHKSQKDIAKEAGFASQNFVSMIKKGTTKLALERVEPLAKALGCDKRELMRLALNQSYEPSLVYDITHCEDPIVTTEELGMIVALRKLIAKKN